VTDFEQAIVNADRAQLALHTFKRALAAFNLDGVRIYEKADGFRNVVKLEAELIEDVFKTGKAREAVSAG
jgi:hypothetical protein